MNRSLSDSRLKREYAELERLDMEEDQAQCEIGLKHPKLNQYWSIVPLDATRVVLDAWPGEANAHDYINASYVKLPHAPAVVCIAAQGPVFASRPDFLRMLVQQRAAAVVVLALDPAGGEHPASYWPDKVGRENSVTHGSVLVECIARRNFSPTVQQRDLRLSRLDDEGRVCPDDVHTLRQYIYTAWPDLGVPSDASSLVMLARQIIADQPSPLIVHCRAGRGRTGCFLALLMCLADRSVSLFQAVRQLRLQRGPAVVEGLAQYTFVAEALAGRDDCCDEDTKPGESSRDETRQDDA